MSFDDYNSQSADFRVSALPDALRLTLEPLLSDHSALLFCGSRRECEVMAQKLANATIDMGSQSK